MPRLPPVRPQRRLRPPRASLSPSRPRIPIPPTALRMPTAGQMPTAPRMMTTRDDRGRPMTTSEGRIAVRLPTGPAEVSAEYETPPDAWAFAAVAHGAGAGMRHPFLLGFATGLAREGIATVRF